MRIVWPIQRQSDLVDGKCDKYLFWHLVTTLQYSIRSMCESVWRVRRVAACGPGTSSSSSSSPRPIVPVLRQLGGGGGDNTRWRHRAHAAICPLHLPSPAASSKPPVAQTQQGPQTSSCCYRATVLSAMCIALWASRPRGSCYSPHHAYIRFGFLVRFYFIYFDVRTIYVVWNRRSYNYFFYKFFAYAQ